MKPPMNLLELRVRHMSIDLCGGDGGMPEEFLDSPDIGTVGEEGGGETVTERMGRNLLDDIGSERVFLDLGRDKKSGKSHIRISKRFSCIVYPMG